MIEILSGATLHCLSHILNLYPLLSLSLCLSIRYKNSPPQSVSLLKVPLHGLDYSFQHNILIFIMDGMYGSCDQKHMEGTRLLGSGL